MSDDLDALVALAQAATPGPWELGDGWVYTDPIYSDDNRLANVTKASQYMKIERQIEEFRRVQANLAYIAAVSPDVLVRLAERLREAEAELDRERHPMSRERIIAAMYDVIVDHPMWLDDDGQALEYHPEREFQIGQFLERAADVLLPLIEAEKAEAWREGHKHLHERGPDECQCGAWCSNECACGEYGTGELLSLQDNPYRPETETPDGPV